MADKKISQLTAYAGSTATGALAYAIAGTTYRLTPAELRALMGVEEGATADQTGAEIKALYEAEADTNAFDDAASTKLAGVEAGATADQTGAEIKALYEAEADTNAFDDAAAAKLTGIATGATANSSDATLLDRANHTGSQAISTVTGLQTALDGKLALTGGVLTGNLGANVATAKAALHISSGTESGFTDSVFGSAVFERAATSGTSNLVYFIAGNAANTAIAFGDPDDINIGGVKYENANDRLVLYANNADRVYLTSTGNVGINEPWPDYKLDVKGSFGFTPGASVTPVDNGDVVFQFTSNTTLTIKAKGSDGVVRSVALTLA